MIEPQQKTCPRCNKTFECNVIDIVNCQCSKIALLDAAKDVLSNTYTDCLCIDCLAAINQYGTTTQYK